MLTSVSVTYYYKSDRVIKDYIVLRSFHQWMCCDFWMDFEWSRFIDEKIAVTFRWCESRSWETSKTGTYGWNEFCCLVRAWRFCIRGWCRFYYLRRKGYKASSKNSDELLAGRHDAEYNLTLRIRSSFLLYCTELKISGVWGVNFKYCRTIFILTTSVLDLHPSLSKLEYFWRHLFM